MKRAIVLVALAFAFTAQARRVVHMPTLDELCPGNESWTKVAACIRRHGPLTIERAEADAKLVRVGPSSRFAGLYLYTHRKKWTVLGALRIFRDLELLDFTRVRFGTHTGYRIDAGFRTPTSLSFDDESSMNAMLRSQLALVCFDDAWGCVQMTVACDVLVHGKAFYSFRGKLVYEEHALRVVGDRSRAAVFCTQPEVVLTDQ